MSVLLFADVSDGQLSVDATAKAMTAAKQLGDVTILCAGNSAAAAGEEAAKLGASKVLVCEDAALTRQLAESTADLIVSLAGDFSHIVAPAPTAADAKPVTAPLAGNIVAVGVAVGDTVASGDVLLTLEAMKMEHILRAEKEGTIAKINAQEGESLAVDAVILELE